MYLEKELKKKSMTKKDKKKSRENKKQKLAKVLEENSALKDSLGVQLKAGRSRLEVKQPLLLQAIIDLAMYDSSVQEKRRSEVYRSIATLDELTEKLKKNGFQIT